MPQYQRAKAMHQYYRDSLSQEYTLPNVGSLPKDWLIEILQSGTCDTVSIAETLFHLDSGLPKNKDLALKEIIILIAQANFALDKNKNGIQIALPPSYTDQIINGLARVLKLDPDAAYIVIAIELLYRIGEIDGAMNLIENNPEILHRTPCLQRIAAMINVIEENYEQALPHLLRLVENGTEGAHPLVKLMGMSCLFSLGGEPEEPVSFSPLQQPSSLTSPPQEYPINWLIKPNDRNRDKPTVVIACDEKYFFEHAIALLYSITETNKGNLFAHLHCYNPTENFSREIERLALSLPELHLSSTFELINAPASEIVVHFSSRRFSATSHLLEWFMSPLIVMDADALWRKKWAGAENTVTASCDVIICEHEALPFWEKVPAGFLYFNYTAPARRYLRAVSEFIDFNLQHGKSVWFLDQIALSACYHKLLIGSRGLSSLPCATYIDINHREESVCWFVTTNKSGSVKYNNYKNFLMEKYDTKRHEIIP